MDEIKTNPESGAGEKTFTQSDVNDIVSRRLAEEKAKGEKTLREREQEIRQRELLLDAKKKLIENSLPVELLDALNVSSPEAMDKGITTLKDVFDKIKGEAPPRKFYGTKPAEAGRSPQMDGNSQLRKAMGLS